MPRRIECPQFVLPWYKVVLTQEEFELLGVNAEIMEDLAVRIGDTVMYEFLDPWPDEVRRRIQTLRRGTGSGAGVAASLTEPGPSELAKVGQAG